MSNYLKGKDKPCKVCGGEMTYGTIFRNATFTPGGSMANFDEANVGGEWECTNYDCSSHDERNERQEYEEYFREMRRE